MNYLLMIAIVLLVPTIIVHFTKRHFHHTLLFILLAGLASNRLLSLFQITVPEEIGKILVTIAMIILLFEVFAQIKIKEYGSFYATAFKINFITIIVSSFVLMFAIKYLFHLQNIFTALIAAILLTVTSYSLFLSQDRKWFVTKISSYLETEGVLSPALALALVFLFTAIALHVQFGDNNVVLGVPYLLFFIKLVIGIGTGIVIGIIVSKYFASLLKSKFLFVFLLGVIISTYLLAEALQGSGIIASIIMALFFGNVYLKHKEDHLQFTTIYNNLLYIFLFFLISFFVTMPYDFLFYLKAIVVFLLYLFIRIIVCVLFLPSDYAMKTRFLIACIMPKELEVVIALLYLFLTTTIVGMSTVVSLLLPVIILSIVVSIAALQMSKAHIKV